MLACIKPHFLFQNTSLDSNASANLPPVMRRLRGRNNFGAMTKAQSFTAIGRQSSVETDV